MKIVVGLNGLNESDKSNQIKLLRNKNPDLIEVLDKLENYIPFKWDKRNFDWLFINSNIEEFLNVIHKSISERIIKNKLNHKLIIIIDKGMLNFNIRILY